MKEIEVKILEVNKVEIVKKLESFGAKKIFDGKIIGSYFDFEDGRLKKQDKLLRLRKKGDITELTLKQKLICKKAKIAEEQEVIVSNHEMMKKILFSIGLKEIAVFSKHRISYGLDNVHFEFDSFPNIPEFLEIEAKTVSELEKHIKKLGFSMKDAKAWSGRDVINHYKKK
jgi:adenylate cyclase, class 2